MTQPYDTTQTYESEAYGSVAPVTTGTPATTTGPAGTVPPTTSSQDPDAIRREIDRTRGRLAADVDTLGNTVSPSHVAQRTVGRAKSRVASLKDSVMGTAHDVAGSAQDLGGNGADTAQHAVQATAEVPHRAAQRTRGNPLAAGAVALGIGWIVGSLLPASQREQELAHTAREQAQPLVEEAKSVAQDAGQNLKEPATQAADAVKQQAAAGVQEVRQEGADKAHEVKDSTHDTVRGVSSTSHTGPSDGDLGS
ncbi:DUF3618 domain-containing protein [Phycicoccus ginsengisoli]